MIFEEEEGRNKNCSKFSIHSKFNRASSGKKSSQASNCICDTNSLVMASESLKNCRI